MPHEKIDLTFLGKSRRTHRDDITISCGKPRNGDIFFLIPYFFDSFAYESKQFRIIFKKDPGRISITVGRKRPSKSQYKRICDGIFKKHLLPCSRSRTVLKDYQRLAGCARCTAVCCTTTATKGYGRTDGRTDEQFGINMVRYCQWDCRATVRVRVQ